MEVIENFDKELSEREIAEAYGITESAVVKLKKDRKEFDNFQHQQSKRLCKNMLSKG